MEKILPKKCPTCGRKFLVHTPVRVCANCKKPIIKYHKYKYEETKEIGIFRLVHWSCKEPEEYGDKYLR